MVSFIYGSYLIFTGHEEEPNLPCSPTGDLRAGGPHRPPRPPTLRREPGTCRDRLRRTLHRAWLLGEAGSTKDGDEPWVQHGLEALRTGGFMS